MIIGTVVQSTSHISDMCRVFAKLETERVPTAEQCAFGTFVSLPTGSHGDLRLIGVVKEPF